MSAEPDGPDADDYVSGGSIQWDDLLGAGAGSIVTLVVVVLVDAFTFGVTGVYAYVDAAFQGLAGFVAAPLTAGESAIVEGFRTAAAALEITGPFAFPLAVALVTVSASLVIWGVSRLAGR